MQFILGVFVLYILYNLVTKLLWPLYKTAKHVKQQFSNIQQQMNQAQNKNESTTYNTTATDINTPKASASKDYIDFEEVKGK